MNTVRRVVTSLGSLVVVAVVLGLASPRAVHALASVLVTVTNTNTNPVNTADVDRASRIPYSSTAFAYTGGGTPSLTSCFTTNCNFYFTPVPTGYRLVVENINASLTLPSTSKTPIAQLYTETGAVGATGAIGADASAAINQSILTFFDPADGPPQLTVYGDFGSSTPGQYATLSGYLINCSVVSCLPIQH